MKLVELTLEDGQPLVIVPSQMVAWKRVRRDIEWYTEVRGADGSTHVVMDELNDVSRKYAQAHRREEQAA